MARTRKFWFAVVAATATAMAGGLVVAGVVSNAAADTPAQAPGLQKPEFTESTLSSVTLHWNDRSIHEQGFKVMRRDSAAQWKQLTLVATRDSAGRSDSYTWVDTDLSLPGLGQCYQIIAYNGVGTSAEQCTVRPDSRLLGLTSWDVPLEWVGLTGTNFGSGPLKNRRKGSSLTFSHRTFGPDLDWTSVLTSWTVQAKGGGTGLQAPVMYGQTVALKASGGGWLRFDTHKVQGLTFSTAPVYEWRILGGQLGQQVGAGSYFGLFNDEASSYLRNFDQKVIETGVDLCWDWSPLTNTGVYPPPGACPDGR